jgi:hypothetical protein
LNTGDGSGSGTGITRHLPRVVVAVAICDLNPATEVCEFIENLGRKVLPIKADVSDPKKLTSAFDEIAN